MNKKLYFIFYIGVVFFLVPHLIYTQVSSEAKQAFQTANVRILEQRINPIDFTLPLLNGETVSLSDYKGKVVILNFWATWCPPCRAEMPSMEVLYKRFQNQGLEILAVDLGETAAAVQRFVKNDYTFPILLDLSNKTGSLYGIEAIPTSYIIDREGKIIARIVGGIYWDTSALISAFDALLNSE